MRKTFWPFLWLRQQDFYVLPFYFCWWRVVYDCSAVCQAIPREDLILSQDALTLFSRAPSGLQVIGGTLGNWGSSNETFFGIGISLGYFGSTPPTSNSGKWRYTWGCPILKQKIIILVVTRRASQHPGRGEPVNPKDHLDFWYTPVKTDISLENWWLEDEISL